MTDLDDAREIEAALGSRDGKCVFRLFLSGAASSERAVEDTRALLEQDLSGRDELEGVDLTARRDQAQSAQIVAAPTPVKLLPPPVRKFMGDMSPPDLPLLELGLK